MATLSSDRPMLPTAGVDDWIEDPFGLAPGRTSPAPLSLVTPTPRHRFSAFDAELFELGPGSSPGQAKRVLDAHLSDIDRRIRDVGRLGTTLVRQRGDIMDRRAEVDQVVEDGEIEPDLRHRLVELEKEFNDVERETARALLQRQRVPSNEAASGSPYVPEGRGGRRSVSPTKLESFATGSPTKFSVPNWKLRNQNRVPDIELAADLSLSLITQVRSLQALVAERDEELRETKSEISRLQIDTESFQQRVKTLDEGESRYREENWNLETRVHELLTFQREAADREKKLSQSLNLLQSEKTTTQRELDEARESHTGLAEEYDATVKKHDIEHGFITRALSAAEADRSLLQHRVDDLIAQNQEFARATFLNARTRAADQGSGLSGDDLDAAGGVNDATPEESPPSSPVKATPRRFLLDSETLRSSFSHAQRQLQTQRSLLHREKTEKLELKRLLQDTREELERLRKDGSASSPAAVRRSKKAPGARESKKAPARLIGPFNTTSSVPGHTDVSYLDDPEWEDDATVLAEQRGVQRATTSAAKSVIVSGSDHFDTANETSDVAFETANETEDFETGAEEFSGSDAGTETETEGVSASRLTQAVRTASLALAIPASRQSYHSTASTSDDEEQEHSQIQHQGEVDHGSGDRASRNAELRTPTAAVYPNKRSLLRLRPSFQSQRPGRQPSEDLSMGSPASPAYSTPHRGGISIIAKTTPSTNAGTPLVGPPGPAGQSLFAELADFDASDDDSMVAGTPSQVSKVGTPSSTQRYGISRRGQPLLFARTRSSMSSSPMTAAMVDAGMMTDTIQIGEGRLGLDRDLGFSVPTLPPCPNLSITPTAGAVAFEPLPVPHVETVKPPVLGLAALRSESIQPVEADPLHPRPPPAIPGLRSVCSEEVEPMSDHPVPLPKLAMSSILSYVFHPVPAEERLNPTLALSSISLQEVQPLLEAEVLPFPGLSEGDATLPPRREYAAAQYLSCEPVPDPQRSLPAIAFSEISWEATHPLSVPSITLPALGLSSVAYQQVQPIPILEVSVPELTAASSVDRPTAGTDLDRCISYPSLTFALVAYQHLEPVSIAPVQLPTLTVTDIHSQVTAPVADAPALLPTFSLAAIVHQHISSRSEQVPDLGLSSIHSEHTEPMVETVAVTPRATFALSHPVALDIEPRSAPAPLWPLPSYNGIQVETVSRPNQAPTRHSTPPFEYAFIESVHTKPVTNTSPKRDGFIMSRDVERALRPSSAGSRRSGEPVAFWDSDGRSNHNQAVRTEQKSMHHLAAHVTSSAISTLQTPLREVSPNAKSNLPRLIAAAPPAFPLYQNRQSHIASESTGRMLNGGHPALQSSAMDQENASSLRRRNDLGLSGASMTHSTPLFGVGSGSSIPGSLLYRPSSASSNEAVTMLDAAPPLPANHLGVIEAARSGSSHGYPITPLATVAPAPRSTTIMGPPLWPASAMRNRPRTPLESTRPMSPVSAGGTPTPRPLQRTGYIREQYGTADIQSPTKLGPFSRRSSVSSFASELDCRFNLGIGHLGRDTSGFGPGADPRLIRAITQTMIGEHLWKYTRKTGRDEMSGKRHRRYFWVHPYTRTLYWSDRDPSTAGRVELRAKSVQIEAVRVVADDNPMPPGLHRKSLIVISPGRSIKFTCTTGQRHETWFNALSYLLLRTNSESQSDAEEMAGDITREDVDEFNPSFGRRPGPSVRGTATAASMAAASSRLRGAESVSSYHSFATQNGSPALGMSLHIPTLVPTPTKHTSTVASTASWRPSLSSRLSGYWKRSGTLSNLNGRTTSPLETSIYEAREAVPNSVEEVMGTIQGEERRSGKMENVRACCDGKHDVGTLSHNSWRGRGYHHAHTHSHSGPPTGATPASSLRSRA